MVEVKRTVKLVTEQATIPNRVPEVEGYPMKLWNIEIFLLDEAGNPIEASIFTKAVYNLHPSFANPVQTFEKPPFRCENEGWGEFDMTIDLYAAEKGGKHTLAHDLNFAKPRYEAKHTITFRNPNAALLELLRKSGPVPGDDVNGARKKGGADGDVKKRKRATQVDMDKLAEGLVKLQEDDLLQVVQMIHDNKSEDTYTKNDVEQGEFHVDLYTLPDALVRMLWDFVQSKA